MYLAHKYCMMNFLKTILKQFKEAHEMGLTFFATSGGTYCYFDKEMFDVYMKKKMEEGDQSSSK